MHNTVCIVVVALAGVVLSGCAGTNFLADGPAHDQRPEGTKLEQCFQASQLRDETPGNDVQAILTAYEARLDQFLGCLLGPYTGQADETSTMTVVPASSVSPEVKSLRGHIMAGAIARYAAFNVDGKVGDIDLGFRDYTRAPDDAADSLLALTRVETDLRRWSGLFKDLNPPDLSLFSDLEHVTHEFQRIYRLRTIVYMTDLIKEAATPTFRRGRPIVANLISASRLGNISGLRHALKGVTKAAEKLAVLSAFSDAYIDDARTQLSDAHAKCPLGNRCVANRTLNGYWIAWDKRITDACTRMADVSKIAMTCLPGVYGP